MTDYTSPKPVDPIWYQPNAYLKIECGCGRRETFKLAVFAEYHCVDQRTKLHRMIARLRCKVCHGRPFAEVTRWRT